MKRYIMERQINLEKSYLELIKFLLMSKQSLAEIGDKFKLTPIQTTTLMLLDKPKTMQSFTCIFHCDASNTTGIIDGLVKKGLVKRYESPTDRRVKYVEANTKGIKIRQTISSELTSNESFLLKKLNNEDLVSFIALINKITN